MAKKITNHEPLPIICAVPPSPEIIEAGPDEPERLAANEVSDNDEAGGLPADAIYS